MIKNPPTHLTRSTDIAELKRGRGREASLEKLKAAQSANGALSNPLVNSVARELGLPLQQLYGTATFYSMLSFEQREKVMRVCDGPVCWLKNAAKRQAPPIADQWSAELGNGWSVERSSCLGLCDRAPAVLVEDEQAGPVRLEDAGRISSGWRGAKIQYSEPRKGEIRVMTSLIGKIDPDSIEEALAHGVYDGLKKALQGDSSAVLAEVEASGLQGRGGAGFPVGRKWGFVAKESRTPHYIVCNADESEPLIFKDRVLIDSNPHQLLEGLAIAGYACGATEAWIYIRGEYEAQARRLEGAIDLAKKRNLLGKGILGTEFSFTIHVHRGAGAYICGEETALLESLEGKRGEPRLRPPFPPSSGFRGLPTAVNNVESFCAVPHIVKNGSNWWRNLTEDPTPGTKVYMLLGHVKNPGLFEAPFGLTLRQAIEEFGGGMLPGSRFNFALCGGAAGRIVSAASLDAHIDYNSAPVNGVTRDIPTVPDRWRDVIPMGAGAFLICDESVSPVALLGELLHFFAAECCGKCAACRVGTLQAREILNRMPRGNGLEGDTKKLLSLATLLKDVSFCGLGQSVAIPINSAIANFPAEFAKAEK